MIGLFEGQRAFVVGASGGIGSAIAEDLLRRGCDVALGYRRESAQIIKLLELGAVLKRRCFGVRIDLTDRSSIRNACSTVAKSIGTPSMLVNSAGGRADRPLMKMLDEEWLQIIDVNLNGAFTLAREVAAMMAEQSYGRVLHVTSVSALQPPAGQANYSAAKAGLISLTRTMARELGPFGITVNAIAPGLMETPMISDLSDAVRRHYLSRIPVRRLGRPEDLLPAVRMFLSEETGYLTGQVLPIDGGLTA